MDIFRSVLTFAGSMHISAIIIISVILFIFFLTFLFNLILRSLYANLKRDFERQSAQVRGMIATAGNPEAASLNDRFSEPRFRAPLLRSIVSEFEAAWNAQKGVEINTPAIIERNFNTRMKAAIIEENCARHSVSVMIVLGLLGTFIGLTISVQSLVLLFRGYDVTELLSSVEAGLLSSLTGMSAAFTTSLFGIACSVVITIMNVFMNPGQTRENLMIAIEEFLDNTVSARLRAAAGDGYEKMNEALRSTFIDFGERIAERFDRTLITMRDDVRGIEEVNNNLRNTIVNMDVSFVRIADAIKASTRHIDDNYQALSALSSRFQEVSAGFDAVLAENAAYSENLIKSVTEAAQSINNLTGDLRGEAQRRLDNFIAYDAAISQMAKSAELIRGAVAAIPEQMYAYAESAKINFAGRAVLEQAARAAEREIDEINTSGGSYRHNNGGAEDYMSADDNSAADDSLADNENIAAGDNTTADDNDGEGGWSRSI